MTRTSKITYILTSIVCLIPIMIALVFYKQLPDQIVTHWDAAGNPNGWSSRFTGAIVFPGILFLVNLMFPILLKMDPKYENISEKIKLLLHWIIPAVSIFASSSTLMAGLGMDVNIPLYGQLFLGILFIVIGNYLPKMSQTYTVGIKLPWTLADEENWDKTHRLAGFIWVLGGLLILILAFLPFGDSLRIAVFVLMLFLPVIYSYLEYAKKHKA